MEKRPNVLWIMADQLRAQALSCAGDPNVNTPNLDRMAAMGVHFNQAVGGYPLCCPFRGSMLTGLYPHKCVPGHEHALPEKQETIAHVLGKAGYHTAYFGKWHLDGFHERTGRAATHVVPPGRRGGFQTWIGYENNNSQWDTWVHGHRDDREVPLSRLPGYETDSLTDLFLGHLDDRASHDDTPFFAVLSVQPPHDPYVAPPSHMARHQPQQLTLRPNVPAQGAVTDQARRDLAGAYAMIENLDHNVGRILEALRRLGIDRRTHVMFFSDHGDMHGSHGMFRKTNPFEESIRVPLILGGEREMGYDGRGVGRVGAPVNHVDLAPTTLGLCGVPVPAWMQGFDYSFNRLHPRTPNPGEPDSAFLQSVIPTGHGHSIDKPWRGVVTRDGWKYVCFEGVSWLLFNLREDPYEQANLAHNAAFKAKRVELRARLAKWIEDTGDQFALPAE